MSTSPTITMRSAGDLVAVLPYLLGYHPRDSLVLVCLRGGQVCLTACQALPTDNSSHPALGSLLAGMAKADPDSLIILGYENGRPLEEAVNQGAIAATEVGVRVHDRVIITPQGWRSLDTGDSSDHGPTATSGVAELVGAGIAPLSSRDALTAAVQQTDEASRVARHLARYTVRGGNDRLELYCSAWPVVLDTRDGAPDLTAKLTARAVLALEDVAVRDLVVARLTPGTLEVDAIPGTTGAQLRTLPPPAWATDEGWDRVSTCNRLQNRLVRLCAMTPDSHAAPPLSVLASWAWWRGDGALARVALERALRCDPHYRLAILLERMVDLAIRPPA